MQTNKPLRIPNKAPKSKEQGNPFKDQDVARAIQEYESQRARANYRS